MLFNVEFQIYTTESADLRQGSLLPKWHCSLYHSRAILKISSKSIKNFLSNVANQGSEKPVF